MKLYLAVIFILLAACLGFGQETKPVVPEQAFDGIKFSAFPVEKIKVTEMTWQGHFGGTEKQPQNMFILMIQGGFRAPTSKDHEKLIKDWLAAHPQAEAIVVYVMEGMTAASPDSKMKAVWIIDGTENLNLYLVGKGDCPGGTMLLQKGDETSLTREEYKTFLEKLIDAGITARTEKLGIWSQPQ